MTSAISIDIFLSIFFSGILVPGGFGKRGTEGKIAAAAWGRKMKKPYLGTVCWSLECIMRCFSFVLHMKVVNF